MTRKEFVTAYAQRSGLSDERACIGLVKVGDHRMIALPCACGEESCEGWAMLGIEAVLHHLFFNAPDPIRDAYCATVRTP